MAVGKAGLARYCTLERERTVMLNGVPGKRITCKQGLQQGEPLSPYLFIIVADVLQRLIKQASAQGALVHPLLDNYPCPVLQYADDILILIKGEVSAVLALKAVLASLSHATGLEINFNKSTFAPIHIPNSDAARKAEILQDGRLDYSARGVALTW